MKDYSELIQAVIAGSIILFYLLIYFKLRNFFGNIHNNFFMGLSFAVLHFSYLYIL